MTLPVNSTTNKEHLYNIFSFKENQKNSDTGVTVIDDDRGSGPDEKYIRYVEDGRTPINATGGYAHSDSKLKADDTINVDTKSSPTLSSTEQGVAENIDKIDVQNAVKKTTNQVMLAEGEQLTKSIKTEQDGHCALNAKEASTDKEEDPAILVSSDLEHFECGERELEEMSLPPCNSVPKDGSVNSTTSSCNSNQMQQQQNCSLMADLFTEGVGYDFLQGGNKIGASIGYFSSLPKGNNSSAASAQPQHMMSFPAIDVEYQEDGKPFRISVGGLSTELDQEAVTNNLNDGSHNNVIGNNVYKSKDSNSDNKASDHDNKRGALARLVSPFKFINRFLFD